MGRRVLWRYSSLDIADEVGGVTGQEAGGWMGLGVWLGRTLPGIHWWVMSVWAFLRRL